MPEQLAATTAGLPQRGGAGSRVVARTKVFTVPLIGIALYLFVIHSYKLPIAGLAVGLALLGLYFEGRSLRVPPFLAWFGAWLLWGLLTMAWSDFPEEVWTLWIEFSKVWLIVLVAVNAIRTPAQLLAFAVTWLGMFALFPVRGTLFNIMFGYGTLGRYAWNFAFENPNDMAAYTLLLLALSVAVLRIAPARWVRTSALAGIFVLPVVMFATQSRGGILGLAVFTLLVFAGDRAKVKILAVGIGAVGLIVMTAPEGVWNRIRGMENLTSTATIADADEESSAEQRWTIWQVAFTAIGEHPIGGVGLGVYPKENARIVRRMGGRQGNLGLARGERDAHSIYLTVWSETGTVGLLLFLAMLGSVIRAGLRAERRLKPLGGTNSDLQALVALRAGLIGFLVAGAFGGLHREPHVYFMMTLIVHYSTMLLHSPAPASRQGPSGRAAPRLARGLA